MEEPRTEELIRIKEQRRFRRVYRALGFIGFRVYRV